jgi:hypothetical protein
MRFFTSQVLTAVNISTETLRHWKRVLAPIRSRDGRSEGYSFRELAALAIIARAVNDLAVPISRFTTFADELFRSIDPISGASDYVLCITPTNMLLTTLGSMPDCTSVAVVRVTPVIADLRRALALDADPGEAQLALPLETTKVIPLFRSSK